MFRRAIITLMASILTLLINAPNIYASTNSSGLGGNGLKVSPVRTDLTINPGSTAIVNVLVKNITPYPSTLKVIINNFTARGETGTPALYLNNTGVYNPHSLTQFVSAIPNVSLSAQQTVDVKVKITIPTNTPGGGYYGAVRFAPANTSSNKSVSVSASVASLILVKVPGPNLKEQLTLSGFYAKQNNQSSSLFFSNNNINLIAKFNNTGNVQEQPFGKIIVKNINGRVILTKSLNNVNPPGNVLPNSIRAFSIPLNDLSNFGKYTVYGNFGYGSTGQLLSAQTTFYVIAPWIIVLVVAIVIIIVLAIFMMPKMFRLWYKRSIKKN